MLYEMEDSNAGSSLRGGDTKPRRVSSGAHLRLRLAGGCEGCEYSAGVNTAPSGSRAVDSYLDGDCWGAGAHALCI